MLHVACISIFISLAAILVAAGKHGFLGSLLPSNIKWLWPLDLKKSAMSEVLQWDGKSIHELALCSHSPINISNAHGSPSQCKENPSFYQN